MTISKAAKHYDDYVWSLPLATVEITVTSEKWEQRLKEVFLDILDEDCQRQIPLPGLRHSLQLPNLSCEKKMLWVFSAPIPCAQLDNSYIPPDWVPTIWAEHETFLCSGSMILSLSLKEVDCRATHASLCPIKFSPSFTRCSILTWPILSLNVGEVEPIQ